MENKVTVSLGFRASTPGMFSFTFEEKNVKRSLGLNTSDVVVIGLGLSSVSNALETYEGRGLIVEYNLRTFLKKDSWSGFYTQSGIEGGKIDFSDANYSGSYKYISILNPEIGFKWQVAKGFSIDPAIGFMWKLEIKGSGNVDNTSFDNFVPKLGLRVGYCF